MINHKAQEIACKGAAQSPERPERNPSCSNPPQRARPSGKHKRSLSLKIHPLFFSSIEPCRRLGSKSGEACSFGDKIQYEGETEAYGMPSNESKGGMGKGAEVGNLEKQSSKTIDWPWSLC
jgi:hypothetical protein